MSKFYQTASNSLQVIQIVHELFDCPSYIYIYWLTKETLSTFFANTSNRTIKIKYLLYSNIKWFNATVLLATIIIVIYD